MNFREQAEEAVKESIEEWYHFVVDKLPIETTRFGVFLYITSHRIKNSWSSQSKGEAGKRRYYCMHPLKNWSNLISDTYLDRLTFRQKLL